MILGLLAIGSLVGAAGSAITLVMGGTFAMAAAAYILGGVGAALAIAVSLFLSDRIRQGQPRGQACPVRIKES